ncbi:hypothetical protein LS78_011010 [Helicobacter bilis]|nr:hypothetical protein LS78_011010 [Helicobacter bilis]
MGNQDSSKWQTKVVQGSKEGLSLTIENGSGGDNGAAAKWSGEVAGGAGTLKINNANAQSEWTGKVVAGNGTTEIKNDGVYKGVVETGTNGDSTGNTTITNNLTWGSNAEDAKITHKGKATLL